MQKVAQAFRKQRLSVLKTLISDISVGTRSEAMSSALKTPASQANNRSSTQSQNPDSSTDVIQDDKFEISNDRSKLAKISAIYHKVYSVAWFSGLMLLACDLGSFNIRTISVIVAGAFSVCTMFSQHNYYHVI